MRKTYDKILDRLLYFAIIGMIAVAVMTRHTSVFNGFGFPKKYICNSKCTPKAKKVVSQPVVKWDQCQTFGKYKGTQKRSFFLYSNGYSTTSCICLTDWNSVSTQREFTTILNPAVPCRVFFFTLKDAFNSMRFPLKGESFWYTK